MELVVKNNRQTSMRDVDITLIMPLGVRLTKFDHGTTNLELVNRSEDFTKFFVRRRRELRAGEELRFIATIVGNQPGIAHVRSSSQKR